MSGGAKVLCELMWVRAGDRAHVERNNTFLRYWSKELWYGMVTLLSLLLVVMLVTLVNLYQDQQKVLQTQLDRVEELQKEIQYHKRKRAKRMDALLADKRHLKRLQFSNQRTINDLTEQRNRMIQDNSKADKINSINRQKIVAEKRKRQFSERMAHIESELANLIAR